MTGTDLKKRLALASGAQLILIDRAGNIHHETPRVGGGESLKEEVIQKRVTELLKSDAKGRATRKCCQP